KVHLRIIDIITCSIWFGTTKSIKNPLSISLSFPNSLIKDLRGYLIFSCRITKFVCHCTLRS
ncbi:MAG TPA: hypothetical protein VGC75_06360, partial [Candidatus Nitrosocosmicus sp.]